MNKKGFTLIELLAVLALLGIIVTITVFSISGVFKSAKEKTEDAYIATIKDAMEMYLTSSDAKKELNDGSKCNNKLSKSNGSKTVNVYYTTISFQDVINSEYKPITEKDLVNPANKDVSCGKANEISINIYRDEDYVYYYSINKTEFAEDGKNSCLTDTTGTINNLPEGYSC